MFFFFLDLALRARLLESMARWAVNAVESSEFFPEKQHCQRLLSVGQAKLRLPRVPEQCKSFFYVVTVATYEPCLTGGRHSGPCRACSVRHSLPGSECVRCSLDVANVFATMYGETIRYCIRENTEWPNQNHHNLQKWSFRFCGFCGNLDQVLYGIFMRG